MGIATVLHGLAHFPQSLADPVSALFITLLYGIPLVLLLATPLQAAPLLLDSGARQVTLLELYRAAM